MNGKKMIEFALVIKSMKMRKEYVIKNEKRRNVKKINPLVRNHLIVYELAALAFIPSSK